MFDSVTTKEIVRFLVPAALGCLAYVLATVIARFISPVPRHVYIGRLVFLFAFILLIWVLYLPSTFRSARALLPTWWRGPGDGHILWQAHDLDLVRSRLIKVATAPHV